MAYILLSIRAHCSTGKITLNLAAWIRRENKVFAWGVNKTSRTKAVKNFGESHAAMSYNSQNKATQSQDSRQQACVINPLSPTSVVAIRVPALCVILSSCWCDPQTCPWSEWSRRILPTQRLPLLARCCTRKSKATTENHLRRTYFEVHVAYWAQAQRYNFRQRQQPVIWLYSLLLAK